MVIVLIVKWSIPLIPVHTDNLLHETCNQDATPVLIEKALQPSYSYDHLGEKVNLKRISQEVTPEIAKTEFFAKVMECIIGDTYAFGRIKLPDGYKNPYSIYGCGKNDICIVHKYDYAKAALINLQDEDTEEESDCDEAFGYEIRGGTVEFKKTKYTYATQQTSKEMIKTAGDLVAKVLLMGKKVDSIIVYGLAASHRSKFAKLLKLDIDFNDNIIIAIIHCSTTAVDMGMAFNWLLRSICIQQ